MKRTENKKFIVLLVIIMVTITLVTIGITLWTEQIYQQEWYQYTNYIIETISENDASKKEKIIQELLHAEQEETISSKVENTKNELIKYGFTPENFFHQTKLTNVQKKIFFVFGMAWLMGMCILVILIFRMKKKQEAYIRQLDEYCQTILQGKEIIGIKEQEEGNLSLLQNDIYRMTIMLKEQNQALALSQKQTEKLMADISHQLKTPLTSLTMMNDLLYNDLPEEKKQEFLDQMAGEIERMKWLIKTLLDMAKLDSKTLRLERKWEPCLPLLQEIKEKFHTMCELEKAKITIEAKQETMACDKKWTQEAISNIIKNAIEHQGKNICIKVEQNHLFTKIIIQDDGEGIKAKDLYHIFDRFYKAENSKGDSLGLGLAFSKSIIVNQGGDIKVKSSQKQGKRGTSFTIKLYAPIKNQEEKKGKYVS